MLSQTFNIKIDSKYIANSIEASLVNLAKAISIESKCSVEESIETVRGFLLKKHNELLPKEIKERLVKSQTYLEDRIKNRTATTEDRELYHIYNIFII